MMMNGGEIMAKRSSLGGGIRQRLSDITNLNSQLRLPAMEKENSPAFHGSYTKNYIEKLRKENEAMMKLIQDRDKVIESTGLEVQKLRDVVQKVQLQNWHLAQSNSQMLAELNNGKDRLKALQHELACKDALFKAKIVELEENTTMHCKTNDLQKGEIKQKKEAVVDHQLQDNLKNESKMARNKKRSPSRSRSMGPTTSHHATGKEIAENKRHCLKRQSVRLSKQDKEQDHVDLFEIDVANFPMRHNQSMDDDDVSQSILNSDTEIVVVVQEGFQQSSSSEASESRRSSLGRPTRSAAGKVQSYKEPSLSLKMRRLE